MALGSDTPGGRQREQSGELLWHRGLKPTYGLVSRRGVFPLSFTLDHIGPMTRTVADNALMLEVIAGYDPHDPGSAPCRTATMPAGVGALRARPALGFNTPLPRIDVPANLRSRPPSSMSPAPCRWKVAEVSRRPSAEAGRVRRGHRVDPQSEAWAIHGPCCASGPATNGQLARRSLMRAPSSAPATTCRRSAAGSR